MKYILLPLFFLLIFNNSFSQKRLNEAEAHLNDLISEGYIPGYVLGYYENGKEQFKVNGYSNITKEENTTIQSVYEIGSITKTFTSLLAQQLVDEGKISWDDPVNKYLPDSIKDLSKNGQKVLLRHLAAHTSGIPRIPSNLTPTHVYDPYADYTISDLYSYLNNVSLEGEPGGKASYSNTGVALLGHALSNAIIKPYKELIKEYILKPLDLKSGGFKAGESDFPLATGYLGTSEVSYWNAEVMAPAGMLDLNAKDLMQYLKTYLNHDEKFKGSPEKLLKVQHKNGNNFIALAWHGIIKENDTLYWHNGGTGGFRSYSSFNRNKNKAAALFINSVYDIDPIMLYIMNFSDSLPEITKGIKLSEEKLEQYLGTYQLAPTFSIEITKEGDQLYAQATNQPKIPIFPNSETLFFYKVVDAEIQFERNDKGEISKLILFQGGRKMPGSKVK